MVCGSCLLIARWPFRTPGLNGRTLWFSGTALVGDPESDKQFVRNYTHPRSIYTFIVIHTAAPPLERFVLHAAQE